MKNPIFVTGNQHKADVLATFLGIPLEHQPVDQEEIQGSLEAVTAYKVKQAYAALGAAVLVEDVSLECEALGGMPGVYIKHFITVDDGLNNVCRMLDAFMSRRATARCMYGYYDGEGDVQFIEGHMTGEIASEARGTNGFGWDAIFCPDGFDGKTRAELTPSDDPTLYPSARPWARLRAFLHEDDADA